jgi:hypothetical protein
MVSRRYFPTCAIEGKKKLHFSFNTVSTIHFYWLHYQVKEQTGVNYFRLNVDPADQSATLWIYAPTAESARMARLLVEVNFKQQLKLLEAERNLYRMRHDLSAVQVR